jgi:hypothetical protein
MYRRRDPGSMFVIGTLFGVTALFLLKRSLPFTRIWLPLIPIPLVAADVGLTRILRWLPKRLQLLAIICLISAGILISLSLISNDRISENGATGTCPEVIEVVEFLEPILMDDDVLVAGFPLAHTVGYYLSKAGRPIKVRTQIQKQRRNYVLIREGDGKGINTDEMKLIFVSGPTRVFVADD